MAVAVGVAGGTGAGKTTLVRALVASIGPERALVLHSDAYYLPQPGRTNFDHPDALETALLAEHLAALRAGEPVEIPAYDFATRTRLERGTRVGPRPLILVDGILILGDPALRASFDLRVWVEADDDVRFIRRLRRDVEERGRSVGSVIEQYLESVRPMHHRHVLPSRRFADCVVPEGGEDREAVEALVMRVRALLESRD